MLNMLFQHLQKQTTSTNVPTFAVAPGAPAARPGWSSGPQRSRTAQNHPESLKTTQNRSEPLKIAQNRSNPRQTDSKSRESGEFGVILGNLQSLLFEEPSSTFQHLFQHLQEWVATCQHQHLQ